MLTLADCEGTILNAIYKANQRYADWSGGLWLSDAGVESVICHEIAEDFARHEKRGGWKIGLEVAYSDIDEWSGSDRRRGRPPALLRGQARADVVLFDGQRRPKYVIEVKRAWNAQAVQADGKRIGIILNRCGKAAGGSIRAGLLGIFNVRQPTARHDPEAIALRQREVMQDLSVGDLRVTHQAGDWMSRTYDDGDWNCQGVCYSVV